MPTHQSLGGASAEQLLLPMVTTHSERYGQDYWGAFDAGVAPHLPASPGVIDLGCGPPLFLRDLARRYPSTSLYGYDITRRRSRMGRDIWWDLGTWTRIPPRMVRRVGMSRRSEQ